MSPCGGYRDKGWKLQICLREGFSYGISDSLYPFFSATVRCCLPYHVQHLFHISPHPGLQPPGAAHQHRHTDLRSTAVHVSHKGLGGPQCTLSFVGAGHSPSGRFELAYLPCERNRVAVELQKGCLYPQCFVLELSSVLCIAYFCLCSLMVSGPANCTSVCVKKKQTADGTLNPQVKASCRSGKSIHCVSSELSSVSQALPGARNGWGNLALGRDLFIYRKVNAAEVQLRQAVPQLL